MHVSMAIISYIFFSPSYHPAHRASWPWEGMWYSVLLVKIGSWHIHQLGDGPPDRHFTLNIAQVGITITFSIFFSYALLSPILHSSTLMVSPISHPLSLSCSKSWAVPSNHKISFLQNKSSSSQGMRWSRSTSQEQVLIHSIVRCYIVLFMKFSTHYLCSAWTCLRCRLAFQWWCLQFCEVSSQLKGISHQLTVLSVAMCILSMVAIPHSDSVSG